MGRASGRDDITGAISSLSGQKQVAHPCHLIHTGVCGTGRDLNLIDLRLIEPVIERILPIVIYIPP